MMANQPELTAYNPTMRDWLAGKLMGDSRGGSTWGKFVGGALGSTGLGNTGMSVADFTPAGMVFSGDEAARAAANGHYGEAVLNAIGAVPGGVVTAAVSGGGKAVKGIVGIGSKGLQEAEKVAPIAPRYYDNVPEMPQRPFELDYPNGAPTDIDGNITNDIEGRKLVSSRIAGRTRAGENDVALSPSEVRSIGEEVTGKPVQFVDGGVGDGDWLGRVHRDQWGQSSRIEIKNALTERQINDILSHEVGHAIDLKAGHIPYDEQEAIANYSRISPYQREDGGPIHPRDLGYTDEMAPYEFRAEALHAYKSDPNYFKTVAPKTAALIRGAVNEHPILKHIIQFNTVAAGAVGAAAMMPDDTQAAVPMFGAMGGMQAPKPFGFDTKNRLLASPDTPQPYNYLKKILSDF